MCSGQDLTKFLQVGTLTITRSIGNRRSATFTLVADLDRMTVPGIGTDLKIYDGTTLLFGGYIRSYRFQAPAEWEDTGYLFVTFSSDGYDSVTYRRTVGETHWRNKYAGDIVREMCGSDLLGMDGITMGSIANGVWLEKYDVIAQSVKDILDDMASYSSAKWYINNSKQLNFYVNEPVTYGPDFSTVDFRNMSVEQSLEDYINTVHIIGAADEFGEHFRYSTNDPVAINERKAIEGGSGVYGRAFNEDGIATIKAAANYAKKIFDQYGVVPTTIEFETFDKRFAPGQRLSVTLPRFGLNTTTLFLVESVDIMDLSHDKIIYRVRAVSRKAIPTKSAVESASITLQSDTTGTVKSTTEEEIPDDDTINAMNEDYISYMNRIVRGVNKAQTQGGGGGITQFPYLLWSNTEAVSIGTTETTPISISMSLSKETNVALSLTMSGEASEASLLTIKFYLDGNQVQPTLRQTCETGWNTIGVSFIIPSVPATTSTLSVKFQTSAGNVNIPINTLQLYLNAATLVNNITDLINVMPIPSEDVSITFEIPEE